MKGLIAFADLVQQSNLTIIHKLYQLGVQKAIMLTGDNQLAYLM
ncbi:hypothetical protein V6B14_22690 (plasmid) [Sporosarcina psychrophila]